MRSEQVIVLQERLMGLGYMDTDEPTEYYGFQTNYAVQLFQRKHGLTVDGIVGPKTLAILFTEEAKPYTVYLGAEGTDVEQIQLRLKELGYFKGSITRYFGTETEAAVKLFQKTNGLEVDGNVGANTREVLYSDSAKKSPRGDQKADARKNACENNDTRQIDAQADPNLDNETAGRR